MKQVFITLLFLFSFLIINGQTVIPYTGLLAQPISIETNGNQSTILFDVSDLSTLFDGKSVTGSNHVFWQDCKRYPIDSVVNSSPDQVICVVLHDGNTPPITRVGAIIEESPERQGFFIAGLLLSQNQCIASYYSSILKVDSLYTTDGLLLINGDTIPSQRDTFYNANGQILVKGDTIVSQLDSLYTSDGLLLVNGDTIPSQRDTFYNANGEILVKGDTIVSQLDSLYTNDGLLLVNGDTIPSQVDSFYTTEGQLLLNGDTIPSSVISLTEYSDAFGVKISVYHQNGTVAMQELVEGRYNIIASENAHILSISFEGQNDDLNTSNELSLYVQENNDGFIRHFNVEIIDLSNNSVVDQHLNGIVSVQDVAGAQNNQNLITIPGLNVFGNGFVIELR